MKIADTAPQLLSVSFALIKMVCIPSLSPVVSRDAVIVSTLESKLLSVATIGIA